jgi:hypothetical protein
MNQTDRFPDVSHPPASDTPSAEGRVAGRRLLIAAVLVLLIAFGIFHGIRLRVEAAARLDQGAQASAISVVEVVHPKLGTDGQEIALPGNAQAFNDTPIYARTSGYVEHWYVDIGAHDRLSTPTKRMSNASSSCKRSNELPRRSMESSPRVIPILGR